MDVFAEQLVKKSGGTKSLSLKVLIVFAIILVIAIAFTLSPIFARFSSIIILIAAAAIYGGYQLLSYTNVEYEYSVTNGEIDIDKILGQKKRTRLTTIKCKEIEEIGVYKDSEHRNKKYDRVIDASQNAYDQNNTFYILYRTSTGSTILIFSPNDKIKDAIRPALPRLLQKNV